MIALISVTRSLAYHQRLVFVIIFCFAWYIYNVFKALFLAAFSKLFFAKEMLNIYFLFNLPANFYLINFLFLIFFCFFRIIINIIDFRVDIFRCNTAKNLSIMVFINFNCFDWSAFILPIFFLLLIHLHFLNHFLLFED